jgi:hypothetical protein
MRWGWAWLFINMKSQLLVSLSPTPILTSLNTGNNLYPT